MTSDKDTLVKSPSAPAGGDSDRPVHMPPDLANARQPPKIPSAPAIALTQNAPDIHRPQVSPTGIIQFQFSMRLESGRPGRLQLPARFPRRVPLGWDIEVPEGYLAMLHPSAALAGLEVILAPQVYLPGPLPIPMVVTLEAKISQGTYIDDGLTIAWLSLHPYVPTSIHHVEPVQSQAAKR